MNRFITKSLVLVALVGAFVVLPSAKSEAAFTAAICNDAACAGGDDLFGTDADADGAIFLNGSVGGAEIIFNLAISKPALTTGMDMTFNAVNVGGGAIPNLYFFASDTGFTTLANKAHIGGTADPGSSLVAQVCTSPGGCADSGTLSGAPYSATFDLNGPTGSPYDLALSVHVMGLGNGDTVSGDFRTTVPEPATLSLLGLGLAGFAARRRRQQA